MASVESGVAAGRLAAGEALPPLRELAGQLGVNANTVAAAYRLLRDRGIVETAGRRGTRVRDRAASTPRWQRGVEVPSWAADLSTGVPDPALLPRLPLLRPGATTYGAPDVADRLAVAVRDRLRADGVPVPALAVCSSALDAIERALLAHLRPGDRVAVEDPGWANLLDLVAALGLLPVPMGLDDDGLLADDLERALALGSRAVVVTSRAQNPTGAATGAGRAQVLRRLLHAYPEVLVVEDDHAAEVAGADLHALVGTTDRWVFVRSVGKAWGPDLRVAPLVGDPLTIDRVRGRLRLGPGWVSHLLQDTVAALWADPVAERSVGRARRKYAARRHGVLADLEALGIAARGASGLNVWIPVGDETAATTRLLAAGYAVAPGSRFRISSPPAIRITVAGIKPAQIARLTGAVAAALNDRGRPTR